ncbi:MAG: ABC transporter permease [Acidimicrobiia bacterium]
MLLLTLADLRHRALRFVVVTILTAVVFVLLFLMTGLIEQFNQEPFLAVDAIDAESWVVPEGVSGPFTASSTLPATVADEVTAEVSDPVVVARGTLNLVDESTELLVFGHEIGGLGSPTPTEGRAATAPGEVVLDRSAGVAIGEGVEIGDAAFTVVGLTDDTTILAGIPFAFLPIGDAQDLVFGTDQVISAVLTDGDVTAPSGTVVITADEAAEDALGPLESAVASVDLIRVLLWVMAAIIIGAVVYLSALERSRDFAVLKAVGARNRSLAGSLAIQAVVVAIVGVGVAAGLQVLIQPVFPLTVRVPVSAFWTIPTVAVVVALVAAVAGMRRVAGADPATAFAGPGA